jgi:hypothetical protein
MHCRNHAEQAIRTFKAHFLSILAGVDPTFPLYLWDLLLPQAELTLNLLRQSAFNPQISTWEYFQGPFDFNKTPLGPVGCRVLIHTKPATRRSWDFRAKEGYYIGPALDSYCCFSLVKSDTKSQVISDTVELCHAYRTIPSPSLEDKIIHGLHVMSGALKDAPPPTSISQMEGIANLWDLFESWCSLGPPPTNHGQVLSPGYPRVAIKLPRVVTPLLPTVVATPAPSWTPPPRPACFLQAPPSVPHAIHITPRRITFDDVPLPRVTPKPRLPILLPPRSPIAHRTRSCTNAPLALFAGCRPYHEGVSYHIPTPKSTRAPAKHLGFAGLCHAFAMSPKETDCFAFLCGALVKVNGPSALAILDPATGKFLEHHQLR